MRGVAWWWRSPSWPRSATFAALPMRGSRWPISPLDVTPPRTASIWVACGALLVWRLRRLDGQKLLCGLSEYCDALGIAQPRSIENVVNRDLGPWEGIIGAHHDL